MKTKTPGCGWVVEGIPEGIPQAVVEALKGHAEAGGLDCAEAFSLAGRQGVTPGVVGQAADAAGVPLKRCQMGLFGYTPQKRIVKPMPSVPAALEKAVAERLQGGKLPCAAAWEIAKEQGCAKMAVAEACETLRVKIGPCQLGAF